MSIQRRLATGVLGFLASTVLLAGTASAACDTGTGVCSLGGQLRAQIGSGLPIPITLNPATTQTQNTAMTGPGAIRKFDFLATANGGFGMPGGIKPTTMATIMMQVPAPAGTPSTAPRSLMIAPSQFKYDQPLVSIGVIKFNAKVLAVQTNLTLTNPHPTQGSVTYAAGGRTGPATVSWCAGLPAPTAAFNPGCLAPDNFGFTTTTTMGGVNISVPATNGLIRYTATKNQFGGAGGGRTLGTAMVFFNVGGLLVNDLPCHNGTTGTGGNPLCVVGITDVNPGSKGVNGGPFANTVNNPANTGQFFTASVGANGTILNVGTVALTLPTGMGGFANTFMGQAATSWGFPATTGRLTMSVTQNQDAPTAVEVYRREGTDMRTAGGQGIVVMVSGAVSKRDLSGPNANRGWSTLNVPEPGTIAAASAGLFALLGCHQLVRRRRS